MTRAAVCALALAFVCCTVPAPGRAHTAAYYRHWAHVWAHRAHVARHEAREANRLARRQRAELRRRWEPTVRAAIRLASVAYGVDEGQMLRVAECESGLDPFNVNPQSRASGVMQFLPSTWSHTPFAGFSVFDPYANTLAAAWLVRQDGGWREWECRP